MTARQQYWFWLVVGTLTVLAGALLLDEGRMFLGTLLVLSGGITILSAGGHNG